MPPASARTLQDSSSRWNALSTRASSRRYWMWEWKISTPNGAKRLPTAYKKLAWVVQDWNDGIIVTDSTSSSNFNFTKYLIAKSVRLIKHNINHFNLVHAVLGNQVSSTSAQLCSFRFLIILNCKHVVTSDRADEVNHTFELEYIYSMT